MAFDDENAEIIPFGDDNIGIIGNEDIDLVLFE